MKKKLFSAVCLLALSMSSQAVNTPTTESAVVDATTSASEQSEKPAAITEGAQAPDFNYTTIHGKKVSLKSFKGKYVVLDFWGIWCRWCVKGIPDMKKYYNKYKKNLEIVSVDQGDKLEDLAKYVKQNDMTWTHILNDAKGNTDLCKLYQVRGFPTKVLIDPKGKIVKVFVGEVPEFYETLDSLLK